jgi:hypothetical protein
VRDNVIANNQVGIDIVAGQQVVQGNVIGTDPSGTSAAENVFGIWMAHGADENQIGGRGLAEGNLISGNMTGIDILSDGNRIEGNKIGTNMGGSAAIANTEEGVYIDGSYNWIGGPDDGSENVISGNETGISLAGENNFVLRNKIGTDREGVIEIPNGLGVVVGGESNIVGGGIGTGNLIAGNSGEGIWVTWATNAILADNTITANVGHGIFLSSSFGSPSRIEMTRNSIFANGGLGIKFDTPELNGGVQPPILDEVTMTSASGTACANCSLELFIADLDPSGYGEGKTYLTHVPTSADGTFAVTLPSGMTWCKHITATATDAGSTSEFSLSVPAGICLMLPPLTWMIMIILSGAGGSALLVIISRRLTPNRPWVPASLVWGVTGGLLGVGLAVGILALPMVQLKPPQAPEKPASVAIPPCPQFLEEARTLPSNYATFDLGTDVQIAFSPVPDAPGAQDRWSLQLSGPRGFKTNTIMTETSTRLTWLGYDPDFPGVFMWTLYAERLNAENEQWQPLCADLAPRVFRIGELEQVSPLYEATAASTPQVPSPTPTTTPTACLPTATALQNATCRYGPDKAFKDLGYMLQGESASIEGRNAEGTWWWIVNPDADGHCWVAASLVEATCEASGVPIVQAPPTPTPTETAVQGCWVWNANLQQNVCTVPCPPNPQPGGACIP